MGHTKFEVSLDGKTLTLTIRETGQPKAQTIIYDKMLVSRQRSGS